MSVWIEMSGQIDQLHLIQVALYMSVWIEIIDTNEYSEKAKRRTLHECVD